MIPVSKLRCTHPPPPFARRRNSRLYSQTTHMPVFEIENEAQSNPKKRTKKYAAVGGRGMHVYAICTPRGLKEGPDLAVVQRLEHREVANGGLLRDTCRACDWPLECGIGKAGTARWGAPLSSIPPPRSWSPSQTCATACPVSMRFTRLWLGSRGRGPRRESDKQVEEWITIRELSIHNHTYILYSIFSRLFFHSSWGFPHITKPPISTPPPPPEKQVTLHARMSV
jgi:hypothetical protein